MKIVGGKYIPGTQGQIGAYVAAIYPGGVADQLHGELQEGEYLHPLFLLRTCFLHFTPFPAF